MCGVALCGGWKRCSTGGACCAHGQPRLLHIGGAFSRRNIRTTGCVLIRRETDTLNDFGELRNMGNAQLIRLREVQHNITGKGDTALDILELLSDTTALDRRGGDTAVRLVLSGILI